MIDPHACYYAGVVINNRALPHKCLSASVDAAWPGLLRTQPFPTAMAALLANMKRGYNTVCVMEEKRRQTSTKEKSSELVMGKTKPEVVRRVPRDNSVPSDPQHPPT